MELAAFQELMSRTYGDRASYHEASVFDLPFPDASFAIACVCLAISAATSAASTPRPYESLAKRSEDEIH